MGVLVGPGPRRPGPLLFATANAKQGANWNEGLGGFGNDSTHYPYPCRRHHDRPVTGLWVARLHDAKRGTSQISQGASFLCARQRTLLDCQCGIRFSLTPGSVPCIHHEAHSRRCPRLRHGPHSRQRLCLSHDPKSLIAASTKNSSTQERNVNIRHASQRERCSKARFYVRVSNFGSVAMFAANRCASLCCAI